MPFDSNKISNIIGTKIPQWLINQLDTRADRGAQTVRKEENLLYLANKTAWVRLVSSIDIQESDLRYFQRDGLVGNSLQNPEDLAKQFVLFGGTSKYLKENSYQQRAGIGKDGAYGILGDVEIQNYGYKPMPGITSVTIETQGKLGSLRTAVINFKCWDKYQLDIIDALYFKLGFTMLLEWGHTFFYKAGNPELQSTEAYSIDPFRQNLTKEEIAAQISKNVRASEGNYDAILGMVTNFNFVYNQDGGYDCTVRLMALGILGDALKINNQGVLPNILRDEILLLSNTLLQLGQPPEPPAPLPEAEQIPNDLLQFIVKNRHLQTFIPPDPRRVGTPKGFIQLPKETFNTISFRGTEYYSTEAIKEFKKDIKSQNLSYLKIPSNVTSGPLIPSDIDKTLPQDFYKFDYLFEGDPRLYVSDRLGLAIQSNILNLYTGIKVNTDILEKVSTLIRNIRVIKDSTGFYSYNALNRKLTISTSYNNPSINSISYDLKFIIGNKINNPKVNGQVSSGEFLIPITNLEESVIEFINKVITLDPNLDFKLTSFDQGGLFTLSIENYPIAQQATDENGQQVIVSGTIPIEIQFNDGFFFSSIIAPANSPQLDINTEAERKLEEQNRKDTLLVAQEEQRKEQEAQSIQISQALASQSALELVLRTIQVHACYKAAKDTKSQDIQNKVYTLEIYNPKDNVGGKPFYQQIFSEGIFSNFIENLITENGIDDNVLTNKKTTVSTADRLKVYSKYGFASELLAGNVEVQDLAKKQVDFKNLLKAYVVPYKVNQEIIKGTYVNHPVYIPFGLLLMILNHNCTMYDSKDQKTTQTPLVYIDFNPNLNFFLSSPKQLSTNPFKVLIPFEGTFDDYKSLFPQEVLNNQTQPGKVAILAPSGSTEESPLFKLGNIGNGQGDDSLSSYIPSIKIDPTEAGGNPYRGKLMNVLLSIDYLTELVRDYSLKDGTNAVYLKTFLEQIILDINKYLGNFNSLRLAYNDRANTFQIIDNQVIPSLKDEERLTPTDNTTYLPLEGVRSIAKSLDIKTDISSRLSSFIAISANSDAPNKATLSSNGDSFGFINTQYKDRYVSLRTRITGSNSGVNDALVSAATQFNKTIQDFYGADSPSDSNVSQATNYYIERMTNVKNDDIATRASTMIPLSVNIITDGVGGLTMGQAFTISDRLLPYTYNTRSIQKQVGLGTDRVNKVGFAIVGLTNVIENNQWNSQLRANMIFLKDIRDFQDKSFTPLVPTSGIFRPGSANEYIAARKATPAQTEASIKIAKTFFEQKGFTPIQISAIIGALLQESQLDPKATNDIGAFGIAQWLGDRKTKLLAKPNYDKLEVQLNYIIEEFNSTESTAGNRLRAATTLEEAIAAMASYERYKGVTGKATFQDVLAAVETGSRIGYSKDILERYYNI